MPNKNAWEELAKPCVRDIIEIYLPVPQMQSMIGPFGGKTEFSVTDFDAALINKDHNKMLSILNDVWLRAPEDTAVYRDEGFCILCNVCDGTYPELLDAVEAEANA